MRVWDFAVSDSNLMGHLCMACLSDALDNERNLV